MKLGTDRKIEGSSCLSCSEVLTGATSVDEEAVPQEGSLTVCIYCGHVMVFGEGLKLRNPTDAEIVEIAGDSRLLAVQRARAAVDRTRAEATEARETAWALANDAEKLFEGKQTGIVVYALGMLVASAVGRSGRDVDTGLSLITKIARAEIKRQFRQQAEEA